MEQLQHMNQVVEVSALNTFPLGRLTVKYAVLNESEDPLTSPWLNCQAYAMIGCPVSTNLYSLAQ